VWEALVVKGDGSLDELSMNRSSNSCWIERVQASKDVQFRGKEVRGLSLLSDLSAYPT
jgi:hypothetical protein